MGNCYLMQGSHHHHLHQHQAHTHAHHSIEQVSQVFSKTHTDSDATPENSCKLPVSYNELILEMFNSFETTGNFIPDEKIEQFMQKCEKYGSQHHLHYSTVQEFSTEKLPISFQAAAELVKVISGQTCRILASSVSSYRPEDDGYGEFRGKSKNRIGSGFVHISRIEVKELSNASDITQISSVSRDFSKPLYGPVVIQTARHLIYDESEMKSANISFYFDLIDANPVIEVKPVKIVGACGDRIDIECVTYDERLGTILKQLKHDRNRLWQKFMNKPRDDKHKDEVIAICISHIHGNYCKYISIGKCQIMTNKSASGENNPWRYFQYNAPTCYGSSGAPVWICKQDGSFYACVPHSYYDNNVKEHASFSAVGALVYTGLSTS